MANINELEIKKILIIDLAFIGDVILAGPLTRAVRQRWPQAEIAMLTVPLTKPVAEMLPAIDKAIAYDKKGVHQGLGGMWKMAGELRREHFDVAICMNFALRGAVVARLAGIPYRLGYDAQHAGWFLTWAASHIRDGIKHETKNHLEVLKPWGFGTEDYTCHCSQPKKIFCPMSRKQKSFRWQNRAGILLSALLAATKERIFPCPWRYSLFAS